MACTGSDIRTLQHTRNFLNVPSLTGGCGTQALYYGQDCQLMELTGLQRNVRNASSPLRTWNKRSRSFCTIGNTVAPPDVPSGNLRFYEACGSGIPLPHMLGDCDFWVVNNHGLCKSQGDICDFEDYAEVARLNLLSENRGRRSSFDGSDEPLINDLSVEFVDVYDITTIEFTDVLAPLVAQGGVISADSFVADLEFACESGCGLTVCGCTESCNDGTRTFYMAIGSTTAGSQVAYTTDGGSTVFVSNLPQGASLPEVISSVALFNGRIYSLAYNSPVQLLSAALDEAGGVVLPWAVEQTYAGLPRRLKVCGNDDTMGILTTESFYTLKPGDDGGTTHLPFDGVTLFNWFDCCGSTVIVVGTGGVIWRSTDGGQNFAPVVAPAANGATDIFRVSVESSSTFWIANDAGQFFRTTDAGVTWTQIQPGGATFDTVRGLEFLDANVGYAIDAFANNFYSTWLGGLSTDVWCNGTNRIGTLPPTFTSTHGIHLPSCANRTLASNTVAIVGNSGTDASVLIGRPQISF